MNDIVDKPEPKKIDTTENFSLTTHLDKNLGAYVVAGAVLFSSMQITDAIYSHETMLREALKESKPLISSSPSSPKKPYEESLKTILENISHDWKMFIYERDRKIRRDAEHDQFIQEMDALRAQLNFPSEEKERCSNLLSEAIQKLANSSGSFSERMTLFSKDLEANKATCPDLSRTSSP